MPWHQHKVPCCSGSTYALVMSDCRKLKEKVLVPIIEDALKNETTTKEIKDKLLKYIVNNDPIKKHIASLLAASNRASAQRKIYTYSKTEPFRDFLAGVKNPKVEQEEEDDGFQVIPGKRKPGKAPDTAKESSGKTKLPPSNSAGHARDGTTRSHPGGPEPQWKELEPATHAALVFRRSGAEATKLDTKADVKNAKGFLFETPKRVCEQVRKYSASCNAIAFVIPAREETKDAMVRELKNSFRKLQEREDETMCPSVHADKLVMRDLKTKKILHAAKVVVIVNVNENNEILVAHSKTMVGALNEASRASVMPNISLEKSSTTSLAISVVQPLCEEAGIQSLWKTLQGQEIRKLQKSIKATVTKPEWKTPDPFIPRNRFLKWRGEEIEEGRIKAIMSVNNSHVEEMLKKSGQHGIIIDLNLRNGERTGISTSQG